MANHLFPWWLGPLLASPIRRLRQDPDRILAPWVGPGMTVIEPGPGMGFFSLPLAALVGQAGRVVCLDRQEQMIAGLLKRARKRGVEGRIDARVCSADNLGIEELAGDADFALAFGVVHEVPDAQALVAQLSRALKTGARLLIAEPAGQVTAEDFDQTLRVTSRAGFVEVARPTISGSRAVVVEKMPGGVSDDTRLPQYSCLLRGSICVRVWASYLSLDRER